MWPRLHGLTPELAGRCGRGLRLHLVEAAVQLPHPNGLRVEHGLPDAALELLGGAAQLAQRVQQAVSHLPRRDCGEIAAGPSRGGGGGGGAGASAGRGGAR